eukprot:scaffold11193_cov71-Cyclotella_meneghiniana.AAC.1
MDAAAAIDPPEQIAASGIHPNGIGEWPMKLRWSYVGCRQCCGGRSDGSRSSSHDFGLVSNPSSLGSSCCGLEFPVSTHTILV